MSKALSRRNLLKSATAGAAVLGWSAAAGGWITTASAAPADLVGLPTLDGTLETAPEVLEDFASDFGHLVTATPRAVLRPGSVRDIVKMVGYVRQNGLKIAMNGQGGGGPELESHSCFGQARVPGGISIDASKLSTIHSVGTTHAVVDAGVTWAQLERAALAKGLTLPALTDYLHISIGGTISVGGAGGEIKNHGFQVDIVDEVEVVTGRGDLVTASAHTNRELFYAVLAGAGQCGIIVRAKVRLVPAHTTALIMELFYDDLPTFLADSEKVMTDTRFQHQEGEFVRNAANTGWRYKISLGVYHSGAAPDPSQLLSGMRDVQADRHSLTMPFAQWAFRLDPFEAFLKDNGFWDQPKPWLSLMIPASKIEAFVRDVLPGITPEDIGAGIAGSYPMPTSKLTRPLFVRPNAETIYFFDLLRFPAPGADTGSMVEQNRRLFDKAVAIGGKRYIIGAVPMTREDWQRHYGPLWYLFLAAKRYFDPDNVLTPGWGFFA